ncbi:hypothetical protein HG531_006995 [Fusarium graminearum]|nr:hypothetical protein HG531_006995 [Fusarium graminearum]
MSKTLPRASQNSASPKTPTARCDSQFEKKPYPDDFERDQKGLVEEEVPADHETESVVDPVASETDETTRNRHISVHFSDRVVGETEDHGVESCADEETSGATLGQTGTDTDEETGTDSASDGEELNLSVVESAMKTISVAAIIFRVGNGAFGPLGDLFSVGRHVFSAEVGDVGISWSSD